MKIFHLPLLAAVTVFLTLIGCSPKPYIMETDYDIHGQFKNYRSFAFLNMSNSGNGVYEEQIVMNTLFKRLTALGYRYDEQSPDLLVSCKFFYEPVRTVGFQQSQLSYWLKNYRPGVEEDDKKQINYYKHRINLPADACQVFIVDAKTNRMVWKGYSGQVEPWSHEQQLVASISRMMDEYTVVAY